LLQTEKRGLSVGLSRSLQKRLNQSRCRLG